MGRSILLLGGGGHCRSVCDSICAGGKYDKIGIVLEDGADLRGENIVGTDSDLSDLKRRGWDDAMVTVGTIGNSSVRSRLFRLAESIGFNLPVVIDPTAVVASDVIIQAGTYIGKKTVVNAGTRIGRCVIVNTGAVLEHDCSVDDYVHISTGAILCGGVSVAEGTHVGAGSVVRQGIQIGSGSLIGIGSVVVNDITDNVTAYGNPCRVKAK